MIQAVNAEIAKQGRRWVDKTRNSARAQWHTRYLGGSVEQVENRPQASLAEMFPDSSVLPHFHEVDEFQVLLAGNGTLGRNAVGMIALHYVDHHTAYGPINAGPLGLTFFTIRAQSDPGGTYLHKPGYKDSLKATKKRYLLAQNIALSTEPVLQNRSEVLLESVLEKADLSDGLGAFILRLGAGMKFTGPDPKATGGQFYLVVNGNLLYDGASYPAWSLIHADAKDAPLEVVAGPQGIEALVLNFPRPES